MKQKKKRIEERTRSYNVFRVVWKKKKWVNRIKILGEVATSLALNVLLRKKVLSRQVLLPRYTRWIAKRFQLKFIIYLNYLNVQKLTFISCVVLSPKLIAAIHVSPTMYVIRSADWDDQKVEFVDRILSFAKICFADCTLQVATCMTLTIGKQKVVFGLDS